MEPESRAELPATAYQLAEQYHVGQPLVLHNMRPQWIRLWRIIADILLGVVIFGVIGVLAEQALFLFQVIGDQDTDLRLAGIILSLFEGAVLMVYRGLIVRNVPASLLVCAEGILEIRPRKVDVTHWDEVKRIVQVPRSGGRMSSYKLDRINRKPLHFGGAFENVEDLVNVIRQQLNLS